VIAAENAEQTRWFLAAFPEFKEKPWREAWPSSVGEPIASGADGHALQLTPHRHGTDGFYISILERSA
ncbi:MAG: rRNA cytosine-C5-methylase, partial [Rhizobiales bacterium]|nr:rRNA cytosine-C5-methylase [Hyphomicrobiales bacterium]